MHHFHLGNEFDSDGKIRGTREVLFAVARPEALYFVDVLDHHAFADQHLFNVACANWPTLFARFVLPLAAARSLADRELSPAERQRARTSVNSLTVSADGKVYAPIGGGISTDGSSSRVRVEADGVLDALDERERLCRTHADEIAQKILEATGRRLDTLDFRLIAVKDGVEVIEEQTKILVKPGPP